MKKLGLYTAAALVFASAPAVAQSPLVHLQFDGSTANSGSAGAAELIVPTGADQPQYIDGKAGQALSFGKGGAVAIPFFFNQEERPQATVTMWIKLDQDSPYERELVSLGPGNGLLFRVTGQRKVNLRSFKEATHDKSFPVGEWVFIAGAVDNMAGTIRLYQNSEAFEATGLDIRKPYSLAVKAPGEDEAKHRIFIAADDFNSAGKEVKHIALDDVRIYDSALSAAQIDAIRNAGPSTVAQAPEAEIGETEKNSRTVVAEIPQDVTRPLPDATLPETLPENEGDESVETTRPAYPEIAKLPDEGPAISTELPPAEESDGSDATGGFDGVGDMTGAETSGIKGGPIDLSKQPQDEKTESASTAEAEADAEQSNEPKDGYFVPVGTLQWSGRSGRIGDIEKTIDLVGQGVFINKIRWDENSNRPCKIEISGSKISTMYVSIPSDAVKAVADFGCSGAGPGVFSNSSKTVSVNAANPLMSVRVCNNNSGNGRMKGLTIRGLHINPADGDALSTPIRDTEELANCANWDDTKSCPAGMRASGLTVIARDVGGGDRAAITGLKLICREVGIR